MDLGRRSASVKFLIRDRAGQFTGSFDAVFTAEGIRILASPPQAPRANAICERMIGSLRREVFDRLLIVNEHHLRRVLTGYLRHYNTARPHRALGQLAPAQAPSRPPQINLAEHRIRRKQVLGGLTSEYQIAARWPSCCRRSRSPPRSCIRAPHRTGFCAGRPGPARPPGSASGSPRSPALRSRCPAAGTPASPESLTGDPRSSWFADRGTCGASASRKSP